MGTSPDRFKGSSAKLIKEEKFRKSAAPRLAQKEKVLIGLIEKFEKENGLKFSYGGDDRFLNSLKMEIDLRPPGVPEISDRTITGTKGAMPGRRSRKSGREAGNK